MQRIAMKLARLSDHQHYKHSVLIVRGGKIIARGFNKGAKHAEVAAIGTHAKKDKDYFKGADLYSFRFNKTGPANSRPCNNCELEIRKLGFKRIFYFFKIKDDYSFLTDGQKFEPVIFLMENL